MSAIDLIVGKVYIVKHSSGMIRARYVGERDGGYKVRRARYLFVNLETARQIVLKSKAKIRREYVPGEGTMSKPNYEIVERTSGGLVIRDLGPWSEYMTITNDPESVVAELFAVGKLAGGPRLFYYDSEGRLDEIVYRDGRFVGFRPGGYYRGALSQKGDTK